MKHNSNLAKKIGVGDFVVTAEFLPHASADSSSAGAAISSMSGLTAVNVADNPHGPAVPDRGGRVR